MTTIVDFLVENAPAVLDAVVRFVSMSPFAVIVAPLTAAIVQIIKSVLRSRGKDLDGLAGWIQLGINIIGITIAWLLVRSALTAGIGESEAIDTVTQVFNHAANIVAIMGSIFVASGLSLRTYRYGKKLQIWRDWHGNTGLSDIQ